jgi:hypothetical protein
MRRGNPHTGNPHIASPASCSCRNRAHGHIHPRCGRNNCSCRGWCNSVPRRWPVQVGKCLLRRSSRAGSRPHSRASRHNHHRSCHSRDRTLDHGRSTEHTRPREPHYLCHRRHPLPVARLGPPNPGPHRVHRRHASGSRRRGPGLHRAPSSCPDQRGWSEPSTDLSRSQRTEWQPPRRSSQSKYAVGYGSRHHNRTSSREDPARNSSAVPTLAM